MDKIKQFAVNHQQKLLLFVGVLVGSLAVLLNDKRKTLLEITQSDVNELRVSKGTAIYQTKYGPIFVAVTDNEEYDDVQS